MNRLGIDTDRISILETLQMTNCRKNSNAEGKMPNN
jgi:hypothetical protein